MQSIIKGQQAIGFGNTGISILLYLSLFLFPYTVYLMSLIPYLSILHKYLFPDIPVIFRDIGQQISAMKM